MLDTAQAANILGISPRRVRQLVSSGDLPAQRIGGSWALNEAAVRARANSPKLKGRPRDGEKDATAINSFILMNREHEVALFEYNRNRDRVLSVEPLADAAWAPLGACGSPGKLHPDFLRDWIASRTIPDARPRLAALLDSLGLPSAAGLAFSSLGLSLSDQYWFRPIDPQTRQTANISWADVNYFDNGFADATGEALAGSGAPQTAPSRSPSNTTNGMLEKKWVEKDGAPWLMKGSTPGGDREPYSEILATRLLERLLEPGEFVPYELARENGAPYSLCPCMVDSRTELIPAADVVSCHHLHTMAGLYDSYVETVSDLAGRDLRQSIDKMIVCDYLMCNDDRHLYNFGLIRDVESLQVVGAAPLYDHGSAFFARATLAQMHAPHYHYASHPFSEMPLRQLALVGDYSWFDPGKLEGFIDEVGEILSQNENLPAEFVELAQRHVQRAIDRVLDFAEEAG